MTKSNLQERIAHILGSIEMTNDQLSSLLGVNRNTIGAYKKGKGDLKGIVLVGLAEKLGYNPEWLLTGKGDMMGQAAAPQPEPQPTTEKAPIDFYLLESLIRLIEEKPPMPPALKAQKIIEAYQRVVEVTDAEPQAANQATVDTE